MVPCSAASCRSTRRRDRHLRNVETLTRATVFEYPVLLPKEKVLCGEGAARPTSPGIAVATCPVPSSNGRCRRVRKCERSRKLESWRRSRDSRRPADATLGKDEIDKFLGGFPTTGLPSSLDRESYIIRRLRCLLLVMCTYLFAKKALTLHLARGEGRERYFGCNLMQHKVLASSYQHLMAEAPVGSGLTTAIANAAEASTVDMKPICLKCDYSDAVQKAAEEGAKLSSSGIPGSSRRNACPSQDGFVHQHAQTRPKPFPFMS